MKIKSACATAGIGKGHKYLGHFAKAKYINKGHNNDPLNEEVVPPKAPRDNQLKGDKPTMDRLDEKMSSVKSAEYYDRMTRDSAAQKAIDSQLNALSDKLQTENRKRQARGE